MTTATSSTPPGAAYRGSTRLLVGIVLGVLTFWLFAGSMGTVAQQVLEGINTPTHEYVSQNQMNLAVSITALVSGLFIVLMGGVADRVGRLRIAIIGNGIGIVGSLLTLLAAGPAALPLLLAGRALQGLSAALVMPSTMALLRAYWDGRERQAAVSWWSIGSWGGSGFAALVGGFLASNLSWRAVFIASIVVSLVSIALMLGTPESKAEHRTTDRFDTRGLVSFMVMALALMIIIIFGRQIGWGSPAILVLLVIGVVAAVVFVTFERHTPNNPFIDFSLFRNKTFAGATLSNFVLNATIGLLIVSQQMLQLAGSRKMSAWDASLLTIGYGVVIVAFIRVGESLLRKYGPRKPMIWGTSIVAVTAILMIPTNLLLSEYRVVAIVAYALFGLGLAFYATPSTDAALSNLPANQVGAGSGIYKMASSLGGAIGAAVSLTVFSSLASTGSSLVGDVLVNHGVTDNIAVRQAGAVAFAVNLVFVLIALVSILLTVPKGRKYNDDDASDEPARASGKPRDAAAARP